MAQKQDLAIVLRFDAKTGQLAGQVRNVEKLLKQAGAAGEDSGSRIDRGFNRARKGVDGMSRQLQRLQNIAVGVLSVRAISEFAGGYLRLADSYKQLNAQIRLVSGSTAEFVQAQKTLQRIAYETHADMGALAKLYAAMAPSLQQLGMGVKDSTRVVELFNKALALSQPTAEEAASATLQFAQAMGSGVLRGEELASILENGRGVALALARGLGVPVSKLKEMGEQGQLTSEVVIQALQRSQQYIESGFAQLPLTTSMAWQDLRNAITETTGEIDKALGSSMALAEIVSGIAKSLADVDFYKPFKAIANGYAAAGVVLNQWIDEFTHFLARATLYVKTGVKQWGLLFKQGALYVELAYKEVIDHIKHYFAKVLRWAADGLDALPFSAGGDKVRHFADNLDGAANSAQQVKKKIADVRAEYDQLEKSYKDLVKQLHVSNKQYQDAIVLLFEEEKAKKAASKATKAAAAANAELAKAYQSVIKAIDPAAASMDDYLDKLDTIERAYAAGIITTKEYYERLEQLHAQVNKSLDDGKDKATKTAKETKDALTKIFEQAVKRIDDAFVSMWRNVIDGSKDAMASIRDLFKNLLAELAHAAITRPIVIGISGSLGIGAAGTAAASGLSSINGTGPLGSLAQMAYPGFYGAGLSAYSAGVGFGAVNQAISGMWGAGQYGAALATGLGAYLPIAGGALSGFSKAGLGGAVIGGAAAYGLTSIGAALAGPIGAAVGAALGGIFGGDIAKGVITGITGGGWEYRNHGVELNVRGTDAEAHNYVYERKDGGWFSKSKGRYRDMGALPELDTALDTALSDIKNKFAALARGAGKTLVDNFETQVRVSLKDMDETQAAQAIADAVQKLQADYADALANDSGLSAMFEDVRQSQERIGETISRVLTEWDALNEQIGITNASLSQFSIEALKANDAIVQMLGGVQNAQAALNTYYNAFFTQAEKQARLQQQLSDALAAVNIKLPATKEAFRALVESLDLTSEKAREQYATLMSLSGMAAQYYAAQEQLQQQVIQAQQRAVQDAFNALQRSVEAEKRTLQAAYQQRLDQLSAEKATVEDAAQAIDSLRSALQGAMDAIRSGADGFGMDYHTAQAAVAQALANARRGVLPDMDALRKPLEVLKKNSKDQYATLEDYKRDQAVSLNMLDELNYLSGKQKTIQEQQLDAIKEQIAQENEQYQRELDRLDGILASAQSQIDAVNGVRDAVLGLGDALDGLANAISLMQSANSAAAPFVEAYTTTSSAQYADTPAAAKAADTMTFIRPSQSDFAVLNQYKDVASQVINKYQSVLGRPDEQIYADPQGIAYWTKELAYGKVKPDDLDTALKNAAAEYAWYQPKAFASGGLHSGGLRLVGEDGPELEITGPSRIVNTRRTQELIAGAGDDMARKLDAIADRIDRLEGTMRAVGIEQIKHTQKTARILNKWDYDGQPGVRA